MGSGGGGWKSDFTQARQPNHFKKLKRDLQFMNISNIPPHTHFFGSPMIFIQHEGPLNRAYSNSSKWTSPNHVGPSAYCWTTSINSMAFRHCGLQASWVWPMCWLTQVSAQDWKKTSQCQWQGNTSFQLSRYRGSSKRLGADPTLWTKDLKSRTLGKRDGSDDPDDCKRHRKRRFESCCSCSIN